MDGKFQYEIPRNVKAGGLFLKLDIKGWIIFLTVSSFFIGVAVWGFEFTLVRSVIALIGIGMTYFSLEIDEKTGESNIKVVFIIFDKINGKGILTPKWGGNEHEETKKLVHFNYKAKNK